MWLLGSVRKTVRSATPWWAKGAFKLVASLLKVRYNGLRALALAHHGGMERPEWAFEIFHEHYDSVEFHRKNNGFTCLEMGPGDSVATALIAHAAGASHTYLVDVGPFANLAPEIYVRCVEYLRGRGLTAPNLSAARSLKDILAASEGTYLTQGLESLRTLPSASMDFIFSNSVLQHVRLPELPDTLAELRRIMHPRGCAVHSLDLRDMMGQSLHHLRFSVGAWESKTFRQAEFYTNRLRLTEWLEAFRQAGFHASTTEDNRWEKLPLRRQALALPYRNMSDDELLSATVKVLLHPLE